MNVKVSVKDFHKNLTPSRCPARGWIERIEKIYCGSHEGVVAILSVSL